MTHEVLISSFLLEKKCPTTKGFHYLKSFIKLIKENPTSATSMKILYLDIAKEHSTTPKNIERCLRTLIDLWWEMGCLKEFFPERPSANQLIIALTENVPEPGQRMTCSHCEKIADTLGQVALLNVDEYVSVYEKLFEMS